MNTESATERKFKIPTCIEEVPAIVKRVAEACKAQQIPIYLFDDLPFQKQLEIASRAADFDVEDAFKAIKWLNHYNRLSNSMDQILHELGGARIPRDVGFACVNEDGTVSVYYE